MTCYCLVGVLGVARSDTWGDLYTPLFTARKWHQLMDVEAEMTGMAGIYAFKAISRGTKRNTTNRQISYEKGRHTYLLFFATGDLVTMSPDWPAIHLCDNVVGSAREK
jgi:hypothetical protein